MTRTARVFVCVVVAVLAVAFGALTLWASFRSPYSARNIREDLDALDARVRALERQKR